MKSVYIIYNYDSYDVVNVFSTCKSAENEVFLLCNEDRTVDKMVSIKEQTLFRIVKYAVDKSWF